MGKNKKKKAGIPVTLQFPEPMLNPNSSQGMEDEQIMVEKAIVKLFRSRLKKAFRSTGLRELIGEYSDTYCVFCEDHGVITRLADETRQSMLLEMCQVKNVVEVSTWLELEMNVFVKEVLAQNQKNYEYSMMYMERILDLYIGRYKAYWEKTPHPKLVAVSSEQLRFENIYAGDVHKYLEMYDNLDKPGNAEFHRRNRLKLKVDCDAIFKKAMKTRDEFEEIIAAARWISSIPNIFPPIAGMENMRHGHKDVQQPTQKGEQPEFSLRNDLSASTEINPNSSPANQEDIPEIQNNKECIKRKCKLILNKCVREYKHEMRKVLKGKLITEEDSGLESDHERIYDTILLKCHNDVKMNGKLEIQNFRQALKKEVEEEFCYFSEKWETTRNVTCVKIENFLLKSQLETTDFLCELLTECSLLEEVNLGYQRHLKDFQERFYSEFQGLCKNYQKKCLDQLLLKADGIFKTNCKKVQKTNERDLKMLSKELQDEYLKRITSSVSRNEFLEADDLNVLHNFNKSKALSEFSNYKMPILNSELQKQLTSDLVSQLDIMFDNFKQTQNFKVQTRVTETELMIQLLVLQYVEGLKEKALIVEKEGELHQYHNFERKKLLDEFQMKSLIPASSQRFRSLEKLLTKEIDKVVQDVWKNWGCKTDKDTKTVEKFYEKELPNCLLLQSKKPVLNLNPLDSYIQCHEKAVQAAIASSFSTSLSPISRSAIIQAKHNLDNQCKRKFSEDPVLGIDFGTHYCRCSVYTNGKIEMVPFSEPDEEIITAMASYVEVVYYDVNKKLAGNDAKLNFLSDTVKFANYDQVRPIFYDLKQVVHAWSQFEGTGERSAWWFAPKEGMVCNREPTILWGINCFTVTDLITELFQQLRESSEKFAQESIKKCVITYHVYYDKRKQTILRAAAKKAGFTKVTLIVEHKVIVEHIFQPLHTTNSQKILLIDVGTMARIYMLEKHNQYIKLKGYAKTHGASECWIELSNYCEEQFSDQHVFFNLTHTLKKAKLQSEGYLKVVTKLWPLFHPRIPPRFMLLNTSMAWISRSILHEENSKNSMSTNLLLL